MSTSHGPFSLPQLVNEHDLPRVPQQARSRAKRDALLAEALSLFGERGYEVVSIEEIVARANTGVGTFYAYFRSKQQILLILMQHYLETMLALDLLMIDPTQPLFTVVLKGVHRAFVPDRAYAGMWRAWREAVVADHDLAAIDRQITIWMDTYVMMFIDIIASRGPLRPDLNRQATATVINAMLLQLSQQAMLDVDTILDATAKMIYHALFVDSD